MKNLKILKFLVIYQDSNYNLPLTEEQTMELTKAHVDNIRNWDIEGKLFLCGLLKGTDKAMLIMYAKTYEEAESYILKDPFIINKVYQYVITEIVEANAENNYLMNHCDSAI